MCAQVVPFTFDSQLVIVHPCNRQHPTRMFLACSVRLPALHACVRAVARQPQMCIGHYCAAATPASSLWHALRSVSQIRVLDKSRELKLSYQETIFSKTNIIYASCWTDY